MAKGQNGPNGSLDRDGDGTIDTPNDKNKNSISDSVEPLPSAQEVQQTPFGELEQKVGKISFSPAGSARSPFSYNAYGIAMDGLAIRMAALHGEHAPLATVEKHLRKLWDYDAKFLPFKRVREELTNNAIWFAGMAGNEHLNTIIGGTLRFIFNQYPEGPDARNGNPADIINNVIRENLPENLPPETQRMIRRYALQAGGLAVAGGRDSKVAQVMAKHIGQTIADEINAQYVANEAYPDSATMQRIFSAAYGAPVRPVAVGPEGWTNRINAERATGSRAPHATV